MKLTRRAAVGFAAVLALGATVQSQRPSLQEDQEYLDKLSEARAGLLTPLVDDVEHFSYGFHAYASDPDDRLAGPVARVSFARTGTDSFELSIDSKWLTLILERDDERTALTLPERGIRFVGTGRLATDTDSLAPHGFLARLLGPVAALVPVADTLWRNGLKAHPERWRINDEITISRRSSGVKATSTADDGFGYGIRRIEGGCTLSVGTGLRIVREYEERRVDRAELERLILRGARRALSLKFPEPFGVRRPKPRSVAHGELRRVGTQDLLLLQGTAEEIGTAHGQLLGEQVRRTIDSTLYLVGLQETVRKGEWFPDVLRGAWKRLSPHIPQRHQRELEAIAAAVPEVSLEELQLGNVFPEYFHCSGFAVFGKATKDGVLYHGRVLDYMTEIGLQQAAVSTVVVPQEGHAFFSAGYAGFVGVVSGMNDQQVSLGEMGGRGRFLWDGVPMATLMRRALEECTTIDEVQALWRDNPRTCEYYYVFADGKTTRAVAVKATPDAIEFLQPGQAHAELGEGIADAVIISAGDRLRVLRERVQQQYGRLDLAGAQALMARPVAMSSNLHSVLFVPQSGLVRVAQADNHRPAVDCAFEEYDLRALLAELSGARK